MVLRSKCLLYTSMKLIEGILMRSCLSRLCPCRLRVDGNLPGKVIEPEAKKGIPCDMCHGDDLQLLYVDFLAFRVLVFLSRCVRFTLLPCF